jgi:hypothetical protein
MMSFKNLGKTILLGLFLIPRPSFAVDTPKNFKDLVNIFLNIVNALIPVAFALALLVFLWGVAQFILNAGNATKAEEGKKKIFYGVLGLFVITAIWGLVELLGNSFGISSYFPK